MKKNLLTFIIAVLAFLVGTGYAHAYKDPDVPTFNFSPDFQVDGLYYKIITDGVELTRAEGNSETVPTYQKEEITVPQSVTFNGNTYRVIRIGQGTFLKDKNIKNITLPEGLKSIGSYAFSQSTIENFNFPTLLKVIDEYAFFYCQGLTSIAIPDKIVDLHINKYAFAACNYMKEFTIGLGVTYMGKGSLGAVTWLEPGVSMGLNKYCVSTKLNKLYSPFETPLPVEDFVPVWEEFPNPIDSSWPIYYLYRDCVVHIPEGTMEKYKKAEIWKFFEHFEEDPALSAIDKVELDGSEIRVEGGRMVAEGNVEVFDLGGRKVAEGLAENLPALPAGFYIVRTPNATAKVVL